jgi:hypothetical protein
MSYSEKLCEKSLRLIFEKEVKIYKNYRPDWLKNIKTGKNLELDFYLPQFQVAIEIQGPHHYDNFDQVEKDKIKESILNLNGIKIIKLSIFQISPTILRRKILNYTNFSWDPLLIKKYDKNWNSLPEIKRYKQKILEIYGRSKCTKSPYVNEDKEKRDFYYNGLDKKIMFNVEYNYKFNNSGIIKKITPVEIISRKNIKCRILGSSNFIFVRKKDLIDI